MPALSDLRHPDPVIQRILDYLRGQRSARGSGTITWDGSSRFSPATVVEHNLGVIPRTITFGSASSNMGLSYGNVTRTTFEVTGNTLDGTSPPNGTARAFSWRAEP